MCCTGCTLESRSQAVGIYLLVTAFLSIISDIVKLTQGSASSGAVGVGFACGIMSLIFSVVLLYGISKRSRCMLLTWIVYEFLMILLAVAGACFFIWALVVSSQAAGQNQGYYYRSDYDSLAMTSGILLGLVLLYILIAVLCIWTVIKYRRTLSPVESRHVVFQNDEHVVVKA